MPLRFRRSPGPAAPWLALWFLLAAALPGPTVAQQMASVADTSPFRPLELPTPTAVRTGAGRPGPGYWQQRVNYRISAALDPATSELTGQETIHYINRSPDRLPYLWLFLEQNICAPGSITNQLDQPPLKFLSSVFDFSCEGFSGGLTLDHARILGREVTRTIYGTVMRIDLRTPLAAGQAVDINIGWHFTVPPYGAGRMGHDGTLYEIAQWYPRMVVYDDVRGWNHEPYIGGGEFYLEYGSFDVTLTLPAGYVVAATGQLQNPLAVRTTAQLSRLVRARSSDTAIAIITASEAGQTARVSPKTTGTLTWHFAADSVRDFAFAASPNFRWDASSWDGILVHTYYRPAATLWTEANRMVREALAYYSRQWYHYPYSHISSIEGPIEGMEYPMMTFDPAGPERIDLQWVLAHELGHQWAPMIAGNNERLYPWMDEGFNTFIDLANAAQYWKGTPYGDSIEVHPLHLYPDHAIPGQEQPMITNPVQSRDLFWTAYQKPALMMQLLRYDVMGKERFDAAFREYFRTWAFKHPTPADFFRVMRDQSGMELDWFWREWIYTTARLDQAVDSVVTGTEGRETVYLSNRGTMVMPLTMLVGYADGTTELVRLPVEMWNLGATFTWRAPAGKTIDSVVIDPDQRLPDVARSYNSWHR
ncbi:MAG: M1 family metallopeptidase [Gemmatimonadales bacterium]